MTSNTVTTPDTAPPHHTDRRSLVAVAAAIALFWASLYLYAPVLPVHATSIGASLAVVGGLATAYGLPQLLVRVPLGVWSDRLGKRKPFGIVSMLLSAVGALVMVFAPDSFWLTVGRLITGISASFWVTLSVHYAAHFATNRQPVAVGQANSINAFSQVVGNVLGGVIAGAFGIATVFFTAAGTAMLGVVAVMLAREQHSHKRKAEAPPLAQSVNWPILRPSIIQACAVGTVFTSSLGFLPVLAKDLGASSEMLGLITAARVFSFGFTSILAARVAARLGSSVAIVLGLCILGVATLAMGFSRDVWLLLALNLIGGAGSGITASTTMSAVMLNLPPGTQGTAMGIYQAVYCFGMIGIPPVAGVLADMFGIQTGFVAAAVVCVIGVVMCLPVFRGRRA